MKKTRLRVPRVPKPKRRIGKSNREVGNYYIRSHGAEINLATKDPDEAIRRSTEYAKTGKANWLEDEVSAARATIAAMNVEAPIAPPTPAGVAPAPAQPLPVAAPHAPSPPAAAAPAPAPAAPAPPPAPLQSPAAASPQSAPPASEDEDDEPDADDWSDDAQQAAEETAQQEDAAPPKGPQAAPGFAFDPQTIEMIVKTAASNAVDYQLLLQAVLIKKKTGDDAPMISHESLSWKLPYQIWEGQFRHWLSNIQLDRVPPWVAAIVLTALMAPGQYQHRQRPKPKGNLNVVQDADFVDIGGSERKAA